jgi:hypothetical protein
MAASDDVLLSCSKWEELVGAYNRVNALLPPDVRRRIADIMINYLASFGPQGTFERMNNRTIAQILAEYRPGPAKVIDSGKTEGLEWELLENSTAEAGGGPCNGE